MISLKRMFLLLALFAVAFADNDGSKDLTFKPNILVHEANLSKTFDTVLPSIRRYIINNGFDPIDIPDINIPLSLLPDLLKTKLQLHHGHLQELSTIYRTGDVILQWTNEKMSLYLNIGFETLDLSHEYFMKFMLYNRKGDCYGRYHDVKASMLVDIDFKDSKINLKFFKFTGIGDFKLRLEGHFADKLFNIIGEAVTKIFRTQVLRVIEAKTYEEINKEIQRINENIPADLKIAIKKIMEGHEFDANEKNNYGIEG